jgi:hypothetical protein
MKGEKNMSKKRKIEHERVYYLILCKNKFEFDKILKKYKIYDCCSLVYDGVSRKKFYNEVKNIRHTKYEITLENGINIIPDLWLWCNTYEINLEYENQEKIIHELFDETRWKKYNLYLKDLVRNYYKDELLFKYQMIKAYKLIRKLMKLKIEIRYTFRLLDFLYSEREEGREYNVYEAINDYTNILSKFIPKPKGEDENIKTYEELVK